MLLYFESAHSNCAEPLDNSRCSGLLTRQSVPLSASVPINRSCEASNLVLAGLVPPEAGPFREDPCRIKELQLRGSEWGMTAVETGELESSVRVMTSWAVAHGDL